MQAQYQEIEYFEKPKSEAKIWRYMTFAKFVSLLEKRALFFCRSDKLGDPFEGSYTQPNLSALRTQFKQHFPDQYETLVMDNSDFNRKLRELILVNCWNMNEHESASLWKLGKDNQGIAIQSTFNHLSRCFSPKADNQVFIGKVKYIDYARDDFSDNNFFSPYIHKRISFAHEQELRALIFRFPDKNSSSVGEYVDVDLDMLIENVYLAPTAEIWFNQLVASVMKKYGISLSPIQSELDAKALF